MSSRHREVRRILLEGDPHDGGDERRIGEEREGARMRGGARRRPRRQPADREEEEHLKTRFAGDEEEDAGRTPHDARRYDPGREQRTPRHCS